MINFNNKENASKLSDFFYDTDFDQFINDINYGN